MSMFTASNGRCDVVVQPARRSHSDVKLVDGSVLAHLGVPSMGLPILFALTFPERVPGSGVPAFDPVALGGLTFEAVRADDFPMLRLGIDAGRRGGAAPAVFNAANEAAVAQFLAGHIRFGDIPLLVERALAELASFPGDSLEALWRADAAARRCVESRLSDAAAHS